MIRKLFTKNKLMRHIISASLCTAFLFSSVMYPHTDAQAAALTQKAAVTVCIDPGHGGTNMGAQYNGRNEKDITMTVANAMYAYLTKFEGINVIMTRTSDAELSLQQRCDVAKASGASFMFCLHFNAANDHSRYGCENWISAFGDNYAKGMSFATIETNALAQSGILNRGVKTKLNSAGNADYYGIIKHCDDYGIPSVIIEHCYVDNANDSAHCTTNDQLAKLGVIDATSVAEYFGLKSSSLGIDYSGYVKPAVNPVSVCYPDTTAPDACSIALASVDSSHKSAVVNVASFDKQSKVLYYAYSIDGGRTFTAKQVWAGNNTNYVVPVTIQLGGKTNCQVQFAVWNNYDMGSMSNMITVN